MRVVAALALAGLRHRPGRALLLALGVAVAVVVPVVAGGMRVSAEAAAVAQAVDRLPAAERAVLTTTSARLPPDRSAELDTRLRAGTAALGVPDLRRYLVYRPLSVAGSSFTLAAADDAAGIVHLTGGRMPASCTPQRCEVLLTATGGAGGSPTSVALLRPAAGQLGLVVTGTAELVDATAVGAGLVDGTQPLLLGTSTTALDRLATLELFGRTTAWIGRLTGEGVAAVGAAPFAAGLDALADRLNLLNGNGLTIRWPADQVAGAAARAAASAERFTVLGAAAAALQLGFCVLAAVGMRRRQQLVATLLVRRGVPRAALLVPPLVQLVVAVAAGLLAGAGVGAVVVAGQSGGLPHGRWTVAGEALTSALPTLGWICAVAVLLGVAVVRWPAGAARGTRVVLDCLLVAAVGLAWLAVLSPGGGTADPLTTSVTTLVAIAAGLVAARVWPLVLAGLGAAGRRSVTWRVAVTGGRTRPLTSAVTAAFVAAAMCATLFAGSYRATLQDSADDQAAYQVPLDVAVSASRDVATPLEALDTAALAAVPGVTVRPVVASAVTAFPGTVRAAGLPLVGLDPDTVLAMHRWTATTGATVPAVQLAGELGSADTGAAAVARPVVPAGTRVLRIAAAGATADADVSLWVAGPDGDERQVPLLQAGTDALRAPVATDVPLRVVAVELAESATHLVHRQHAVGEGNTDQPLAAGRLTLGAVTADGTPVPWSWAGWGSDAATVDARADRLAADYRIDDVRVVLTPGFVPLARLPELPVATDPQTAGSAVDGIVPVDVGATTVRGRVVATLPRMPTMGGRYLVADRAAVAALLDRSEPGTAAVTQVWLGVPDGALPAVRQLLAAPPASTATVVYRADVRTAVATDPVAARSGTLLTLAGIVALLLALVAIALAVRIEDGDGAADGLSLELDGLPPARVRRTLLLRACLVLAVGIPFGAAVGLLLTGVAVRLIGLGSAGVDVQPPVQVALGGVWAAVLVVVAVAGGVGVATVTAAAGLRGPRPLVPEMDLR
ncbi:hypothetical protein [Nakamurella endophytica]|uniref:FtsX-like permease family protein n=1 Tax=Nakamurella endophytica TaxID=1748367 RepID=A0A917SQ38_9ACTN|nr:hypothetical protein [Nakamurella endophytica]GGL90921.1 hypothetical protein GCM10011594_08250 [Nakamurella endophytica]